MTADTETEIPAPGDPLLRAEPLPWQAVKSSRDDPESGQRVKELLDSDD